MRVIARARTKNARFAFVTKPICLTCSAYQALHRRHALVAQTVYECRKGRGRRSFITSLCPGSSGP
jgi:hypothetical protein